jgi:signal transduction histidine kinase/ActR/RegA family two-component response regulator
MADSDDLRAYRECGIHAVQTTPLRSRDGRIVGMISTHWHQPHEPSERDLRLLDVLARQAADLIERKQAEDALREADRRKDEFLAILAHELRNPLAPIRNSLNILQLTHKGDPAVERLGEMMDRQVNHMVRMVDDLMEVSRITRGKVDLRKERIEVAAVLRSAVETSRPFLEAAGHQLIVAIPPESLTVEGDFVRLTQVVANILNNAVKYTAPAGKIQLTGWREGEEVAISVRDTGIGIPVDMLHRVFDPFMQIDRHAHRAQGGLGIGLTLVKSLVEMHGGTVQASSEGTGRGSEFVIRLPLASSPPTADLPVREKSPSPALAPRRVLVVDDNHDAADSLGTLLKMIGADVRVVYSGPDALKALETFKPAVILLDIGMPGMDGHEVARRIRSQPQAGDVTLIALTGWGHERDRNLSQTAGFDYHLIKPADLSALETLLVSLQDSPKARGT